MVQCMKQHIYLVVIKMMLWGLRKLMRTRKEKNNISEGVKHLLHTCFS